MTICRFRYSGKRAEHHLCDRFGTLHSRGVPSEDSLALFNPEFILTSVCFIPRVTVWLREERASWIESRPLDHRRTLEGWGQGLYCV